jgi:DNA-directed RNA polymerase subunit RPC12/RpoP
MRMILLPNSSLIEDFMRCMSCGANIPPEWVNAIQRNECPGCGGEIMSGPTQELLKDLTEALERMPNDPQGVAGWLLSNYRFQKMGSGEPVEKFHRKGGGKPGDIDENGLKVDPTYTEFIKRNEAGELVARGEQLAKFKHSQNGKIAEFASMIQGVGDPYGDDTVSTTEAPDDTAAAANADEQKAYLELKAAGFDPFKETPVGGITDMSQAINPQDVVNLMSQNQEAPLKEEMMLAQSEEGRRYLQRDQFKKLKAQDAIAGGGGGSFRR